MQRDDHALTDKPSLTTLISKRASYLRRWQNAMLLHNIFTNQFY